MESPNPLFALYGGTNECARTGQDRTGQVLAQGRFHFYVSIVVSIKVFMF